MNWATLIPPVLNQGCKWRVTHDMTSAVYSADTPFASGWVGISGLPMVQNVCPTATVPSGFVPINTYQTVLGPLTSSSSYYGVLVSPARPFVCGNPAFRGSSTISIVMAPLTMGVPSPDGSPNIDGVHVLRFDLISDA